LDKIDNTTQIATNATDAAANDIPIDAVIPRVIKPIHDTAATESAYGN